MTETVLRVVQALEVIDSFSYMLNDIDILYLTNQGYKVEVIENITELRLYDCIITTNEQMKNIKKAGSWK